MAHPTKDEVLKLDFDRRLMLQFRGSVVTSDAATAADRREASCSIWIERKPDARRSSARTVIRWEVPKAASVR